MNDWLDKYDKQIRADTINVLSSIVLEELKEIANDEDYYFDKDNLSLVSSVILTNAEKIKGLRLEYFQIFHLSRKVKSGA